MTAKLPAPKVVIELSSNLSPMPTWTDPLSTVTCSLRACECGGILYPFGIFSRIVYGPGFIGSPSRTAICAPAGKAFGAGPHLIWSGVKAFTCDIPASLFAAAAGADFAADFLVVVFVCVAATPSSRHTDITVYIRRFISAPFG